MTSAVCDTIHACIRPGSDAIKYNDRERFRSRTDFFNIDLWRSIMSALGLEISWNFDGICRMGGSWTVKSENFVRTPWDNSRDNFIKSQLEICIFMPFY